MESYRRRMSLRRPIFIYSGNHVGGGEYLCLRRAEAAVRLGLRPVIITSPGPMDEAYRRVAERGQAHAFAEHHPAAATERLRALLSRPAVAPTPHPWPLPKWRRLLGSLSRGYAWRRPLAREG